MRGRGAPAALSRRSLASCPRCSPAFDRVAVERGTIRRVQARVSQRLENALAIRTRHDVDGRRAIDRREGMLCDRRWNGGRAGRERPEHHGQEDRRQQAPPCDPCKPLGQETPHRTPERHTSILTGRAGWMHAGRCAACVHRLTSRPEGSSRSARCPRAGACAAPTPSAPACAATSARGDRACAASRTALGRS